MVSTLIFGSRFAPSLSGMVLVTITSVMQDCEMFCTAGPESTGWDAQALLLGLVQPDRGGVGVQRTGHDLGEPLERVRLACGRSEIPVPGAGLGQLGRGQVQVAGQQRRLAGQRPGERGGPQGSAPFRGPAQVAGQLQDLGVRCGPVQQVLGRAQVAVEDGSGHSRILPGPVQLGSHLDEPLIRTVREQAAQRDEIEHLPVALTREDQPLRLLRRDLQIIFQDPFGSLDPRFRVLDESQSAVLRVEAFEAPQSSAVGWPSQRLRACLTATKSMPLSPMAAPSIIRPMIEVPQTRLPSFSTSTSAAANCSASSAPTGPERPPSSACSEARTTGAVPHRTQYGFTSAFDIWSMWENTRHLRDRVESGAVERIQHADQRRAALHQAQLVGRRRAHLEDEVGAAD